MITGNKTKAIFTTFFLFLILFSSSQIYTIGPMFHYYFGDRKGAFSWGIEGAMWDFSKRIPYGYDVGLEFQKSKFRIYSEIQTGIIFAGVSGGLGLAFKKEERVKLFLQGSIWANALIGLDFRLRTLKDDNFAPGVYVKIPFGDLGL